MRAITAVMFIFIISFNSHAQSEIYVNDTLHVGVRAKPASGAKKVSTVKTGEVLVVIDSSNSKYYKVKTPAGKVGWVSRSYVSQEKPAFMRLEIAKEETERANQEILAVNEQLQSVQEEIQAVETQFDQVQEINLSLEGELSRLKEEKVQLQSEIDEMNEAGVIPEEYLLVAWLAGIVVLLLLGYFIGGLRVRNQLRNRLGGLDI